MNASQLVRGPLLIPRRSGSVDFFLDGLLAADAAGTILYAGAFDARHPLARGEIRTSAGVMMPPLLDIHTHIPQHPIRGRFVEGVPDDAPQGKLLAGLSRNVFPAEARCDDVHYAEQVVKQFLQETLSHGVVGGAAYMTCSAAATEIALTILPPTWRVGMVLMNQNCPDYIRTDEPNIEADMKRLAKKFGPRLIATDRFAVSVDTSLRRRAVALAREFGLRTQTHLNEQTAEKNFVEQTLYPSYRSYTDVYLSDGLLNHRCIAAHCIHMRDDEWHILRDTNSVVAHCPTSNELLGSGVMPLDDLKKSAIPYAIATDVGASPTVSMLAEMRRFLQAHTGRSTSATPTEALYRSTLAPAELLDLSDNLGRLEPGAPLSFIEVEPTRTPSGSAAQATIESILPVDPDNPTPTVKRVTLAGRAVFQLNA